jgi:hypothetical protein
MCNLYSITTNQAAIIALFRVMNRYVGNPAGRAAPTRQIRRLRDTCLLYGRSLTWPLLSTTSDTSLPFLVALTAVPSAVDLMSRICE